MYAYYGSINNNTDMEQHGTSVETKIFIQNEEESIGMEYYEETKDCVLPSLRTSFSDSIIVWLIFHWCINFNVESQEWSQVEWREYRPVIGIWRKRGSG